MRKRICHTLAAVLGWLRAGYPETSRTGHSPLLALHGPLALTQKQKDCVTAQLDDMSADITVIQVAITKATHRLPTPSQTREIVHTLQQRRSCG